MESFNIFKALCLCITAIAFVTPFTSAVEFASGTGEPNNPYQIVTAEQLISIGSDPNLLNKHFVLINDIDLDPNLLGGKVFNDAVIAPYIKGETSINRKLFIGSFNGNGYKIKNLTINGSKTYFLGLFGKVGKEAQISNLGLVSVSFIADDSISVGSLCGLNQGCIKHCYLNGSIFGKNRSAALGGLVGDNYGGRIINCYSDCDVSGEQSECLGGLVGQNWFSGRISCCYSSGAVIGYFMVGGLAGSNAQADITDCYATGEISSTSDAGGLVGFNEDLSIIKNCFAIGHIFVEQEHKSVGGLIGSNEGIIYNCFWDIETSGMQTSDGGWGLRTTQMMDPNIYSLNGWGGDPNWVLDSGKDYPRLVWEGKNGQIIPEPIFNFEGSGTKEEPYIIANAEQLSLINISSVLWDKSFVLVCDVDINGIDFRSIGFYNGTNFTGVFNGQGHVIRNFTIDMDCKAVPFLGLFGYVGNRGWICNLGLENASICTSNSYYIGSLAECVYRGTITNCYATGSINSGDSSASVGGLVGYNLFGNITNCFSTVSISGGQGSQFFGGLIGTNQGTIIDCYATGPISAGDRSSNLGGLVGRNGGYTGRQCVLVRAPGYITKCYATGCILTGKESQDIGGLIGDHLLGDISACYFITSSECGNLNNGLGFTLTDEQMKQRANFVDWDFENIWMICEGKDYPRLQWENVQCEE